MQNWTSSIFTCTIHKVRSTNAQSIINGILTRKRRLCEQRWGRGWRREVLQSRGKPPLYWAEPPARDRPRNSPDPLSAAASAWSCGCRRCRQLDCRCSNCSRRRSPRDSLIESDPVKDRWFIFVWRKTDRVKGVISLIELIFFFKFYFVAGNESMKTIHLLLIVAWWKNVHLLENFHIICGAYLKY